MTHLILLIVALQHLGYMALSRRNSARLLARGGEEVGRWHLPLFVALYVAWFVAMAAFIDPGTPPSLWWIGVYLLLQAFRAWVMLSLGEYWTVRVITVPGAPLVVRGPYRFMRHPNYALVVGEVVSVPMIFGAWRIAAIMGLLVTLAVFLRIRVEDAALAPLRKAGP